MPSTQAAAAVTDGYRARLLALRDSTALAIAALLSDVNLDARPTQLDRDLAAWRTRAATLAVATADQATALTLTYLSAYLVASGAQRLSVTPDTERPIASGLDVVRGAMLWRLGRRDGRGQAIASAAASARRVSRDIVTTSALSTLSSGIAAEPQITGWSRATSSSCCRRCADQAGQVFRDTAAMDRHPSCRCTQEPTVLGRAETFRRQSPTVVAP